MTEKVGGDPWYMYSLQMFLPMKNWYGPFFNSWQECYPPLWAIFLYRPFFIFLIRMLPPSRQVFTYGRRHWTIHNDLESMQWEKKNTPRFSRAIFLGCVSLLVLCCPLFRSNYFQFFCAGVEPGSWSTWMRFLLFSLEECRGVAHMCSQVSPSFLFIFPCQPYLHTFSAHIFIALSCFPWHCEPE